MSDAVFQDLIVRMAADHTFAERVRNSPTEALAGLDLTSDEVAQLATLSADSEAQVEVLGERQSKSSLFFAGGMPHDSHTAVGADGGVGGIGGGDVHHVDLGIQPHQLQMEPHLEQGTAPETGGTGVHDIGGAHAPSEAQPSHLGNVQGADLKLDTGDFKLHDIGVQDQKIHDVSLADQKIDHGQQPTAPEHQGNQATGAGDLKVQDFKLDHKLDIGDSKLHGGGADLKLDTGDLKVHDIGVQDQKIHEASLADQKIDHGQQPTAPEHQGNQATGGGDLKVQDFKLDQKLDVGDAKIHQGIGDLKVHDVKFDAGDAKLHGGGADLKVDTGDLKVHDIKIDHKLDVGDAKIHQGIGDLKVHDVKFDAGDAKLHGGGADLKLDTHDFKLDHKLDAGDAKLHGGGAGQAGAQPAAPGQLHDIKFDSGDSKLHGGGAGQAGAAPIAPNQLHDVKIDTGDPKIHGGGADLKFDTHDIKLDHKLDAGDAKLHGGGAGQAGAAPIAPNQLHDVKIDTGDPKIHGAGADLKFDTHDIKLDHKLDVGDAKIHQGIGDLKVHDIKLDAGDSKLHGGGADLKVDTGDLKVHDVKLDAGATERQQHIGNVKFDDLKFQDAKVHDAPSGMGEAKGQDGGGGGTPSGMGEAKAHDGGGNDPARGSGMGEAKAHDGGGNDPARGLGMGEAKIHEPGKIDLSGSDLKVGFSDVKVQLGDIKGESIDPVHKPDFGLSADHKLEQPGDRDYGKVSIGYGDHKLYEGLGQKLDPGDIKLHEGADLKTVPIDHKIDMGDSKLGHDIKFGDGKLGPDDFKLGDSKLHEGLGQKLDPGDVKIHDGIGDQKLHDVGGLGTGGDASGGATDPGAGHGGGVYYGPDGQPHDAGSIQQTSTGQPYYVDSQGHGHAFYPAEGPGAEPAPGAHVDAHGMYMGSDGHPHHVGGDSSQVPAHSQPLDMNSKTGGPAGGPIEGDWKTGGGAYWGTDGQAHAYGTIETTSTGQAYYVDPQGNGHPFHPAAGPGAEPGPHAQVDLHGMYRGADGQMHHVGGDTSQVPAHSQALEVGGKAGGPTGGPIEGDWKMGGGAYWGTDGHAHAFGSIEHTSTGQAYYVDPQGNGHPFHPGVGPGAEPSPNAQVDVHGMYRGVDGQLHHVGGDTSQVPSHSQPLGVDGKTGGPAAGNIEGDWKTGGGAYWGPDGQAHAYGMIENTSTGQAYYVDAQGNGHAFFPADGPGAEPGPHAQVDVHGMYRGVDGQVHHVGGDPAAIPAHSDTFDAYGGKVGGPIGPIEGDWKAAGGGYWGTDGHAHAFGIIEHTSTGHAYYVDMQGNSHPFYPASGEGAVPLPNSQVDHWGMYRGVDGHMHHVGGNPGAIPAQAELVQQGAKGEVPQGTDAALKAGGGYAYWGSDGLAHPAGAIDHTSTGQAFYVDVRGHGHPFYPAAGEGAHPAPNAHVDVNGFYRGVDGQMHHVGQDPSEVPTTEEMVGSAGKGGAKF